EAAVFSGDPREQCGNDERRHPSAAEKLRIDVVAAEQDEVRLQRRRFLGNGSVTRDVAGVRTEMEVRQKYDAQGAFEPRPAGQGQRIAAQHMRLRMRETAEPT